MHNKGNKINIWILVYVTLATRCFGVSSNSTSAITGMAARQTCKN